MGKYRAQFFESVDLKILQYEVNEFLSNLPDGLAEPVGIAMGGSRAGVLYRMNKTEQELIEMAKKLADEEKRKIKQEAERPVSEEELMRIVEENRKKQRSDSDGDTPSPTPTPKIDNDGGPPPSAEPIPIPTMEIKPIREPGPAIPGTVKKYAGIMSKMFPELEDLTGEELEEIIGTGRSDMEKE